MRLICLAILISSTCVFTSSDQLSRPKRQLSLFTVVNFPNDECTTKSSTSTKGVCFTTTECQEKGGTADGNCASSFGVCCMFSTSTCGTTVNQNITYLRNPAYPSTYTSTSACKFSVTPMNSNICQLRLDFDAFDITEVTTTGVCTDQFTITGPTGRNPPVVCGTLTGSHIYIENGRSTAASTFSFNQATGGLWSIKVSQIECSSLSRALPECHQYVTGTAGTLTSYNYPNTQLKNTKFNFCVRTEKGYCGIQYSQATPTASPNTFQTGKAAVTTSINGNAPFTADVDILGFILIPSGSRQSVYSGSVLNDSSSTAAAVAAAVPPAVVGVKTPGVSDSVAGTVSVYNNYFRITHIVQNTDSTEAAPGFKLDFTQLPCGSQDPRTS